MGGCGDLILRDDGLILFQYTLVRFRNDAKRLQRQGRQRRKNETADNAANDAQQNGIPAASSMMRALELQTYNNTDKTRFISATEKKTNAFFFDFIILATFPISSTKCTYKRTLSTDKVKITFLTASV